MNQPQIETERLLLAPFHPADSKEVQRLAGNFSVSSKTLNIPHPYKDGMAEQWIAAHSKQWAERQQAVFAVRSKDGDHLVGAISLEFNSESQAELGYWIGEPYWGKGYATEAAQALVSFAFNGMNLSKITARYLSTNKASGRVMEKIGMKHVRTFEDKDRNGNLTNFELFEIINTT